MTAIRRVDGLVIDGDDTIALARFWAATIDTKIASIANEGEPNEAHYCRRRHDARRLADPAHPDRVRLRLRHHG